MFFGLRRFAIHHWCWMTQFFWFCRVVICLCHVEVSTTPLILMRSNAIGQTVFRTSWVGVECWHCVASRCSIQLQFSVFSCLVSIFVIGYLWSPAPDSGKIENLFQFKRWKIKTSLQNFLLCFFTFTLAALATATIQSNSIHIRPLLTKKATVNTTKARAQQPGP